MIRFGSRKYKWHEEINWPLVIGVILMFVIIIVDTSFRMKVKNYESIQSCLANCSYESSFWYTHGDYVDCVQPIAYLELECIYNRLEDGCESFPECGCCDNITLRGEVK